jgi:hypothetical protein
VEVDQVGKRLILSAVFHPRIFRRRRDCTCDYRCSPRRLAVSNRRRREEVAATSLADSILG